MSVPPQDVPVALVTGASRNIGRAAARALAADGHAVACFGRDRAALEETAAMIHAAGGRASVHAGDATEAAALEGFVADAVAAHGRIDVVVNNAGVMREASVEATTPGDFRAVLEVNLVAAFVLARAALPHLRAHGTRSAPEACVVNIGSMFAAMGVASAASYCASKAGLEGLTRALAAEWARDGIRVVCIAPGYVHSDISAPALSDPELGRAILRRIPQRRVGTADEIGALVAFLVSPRAAFITGETIVIDGGQRMHV